MPDITVVELTSGVVPIPGPQGPVGPVGPAGLTGATGPAGANGVAGPQGPAGPAGADGPRGVQGLTGPVGATGPVGPQGPKGDTGAAGSNGAAGATGPQGLKGDKGDRGVGIPTGGTDGQVLITNLGAPTWTDFPSYDPGLTSVPIQTTDEYEDVSSLNVDRLGFSPEFKLTLSSSGGKSIGTVALRNPTSSGTGATGPAGPQGPVGPQGIQGIQGPKGDTGSQGPIGLTGPAGADGAAGAKGDTGATGPKGDKGDTGDAGPQGIQGVKGDTGTAGTNGTNGTNGQGVPTGGTTGQVLQKTSATDFATAWATPASGGTGTVTTISVVTANGVSGTVANPTTTPAITLNVNGAITPSSVTSSGVVVGSNIVRGLQVPVMGKPADGEIVYFGRAPYACTVTTTNSFGDALTAATATAVFTVKKGSTTLGTFTFAAGAITATKTFPSAAIAKNDLITITAPATADATLKDITFLLAV